jgi:hypothetical protein
VALTAAQIIDLATQIAKCPGFTAQALSFLNAVLQELAQDYDFLTIRKTFSFNFDTTVGSSPYAPGSGPNPMPTDFLRLHRKGAFYQIFQVPYALIGVTQEEFDSFVQQPGLASYPYLAYVDVSLSPPGLFVWPPASGNYPVTIRYNPQMPDITNTTQVPWFPNTNYLYTRVAGELMKITNDDRWQSVLGDTDPDRDQPGSACSILRSYLKMKDDPETAPKSVTLDRRHFKPNIANLRNTKTIGW